MPRVKQLVETSTGRAAAKAAAAATTTAASELADGADLGTPEPEDESTPGSNELSELFKAPPPELHCRYLLAETYEAVVADNLARRMRAAQEMVVESTEMLVQQARAPCSAPQPHYSVPLGLPAL